MSDNRRLLQQMYANFGNIQDENLRLMLELHADFVIYLDLCRRRLADARRRRTPKRLRRRRRTPWDHRG